MSDLVQSEIFFFITSIAVVVLSVMTAIALYYVIRVVKDVQEITSRVREASALLERDVKRVRRLLVNKLSWRRQNKSESGSE